jgi:hypothetical protein
MYEYIKDKDVKSGGEFLQWVERFYPNAKMEVLGNLEKSKKTELLEKFVTVLGNGIRSSYEQKVNGKIVFGDAGGRSNAGRSLYGKGPNIYVKSYLLYCYYKGIPVYSGYINAEEKGAFNPGAYTAITEDLGKEIAKNALRYFTWGVEYNLEGNEWGYRGEAVYGSVNRIPIKGGTKSWFDTIGSESRGNNYWGGTISGLTKLPEVEVKEGGRQIEPF